MFLSPQQTRYDINFKIWNKIPVCINPWFWVIIFFIGWNDNAKLISNFNFIFCLFFSVLIHELGHAITAFYFGATDARIILYGMGGVTTSNVKLIRKEFIIELLCGPGAGFVLCVFSYLILKFSGINEVSAFFSMTLAYLVNINLLWGLLNLIPVFPLDGGQIMKELISIKRPWESQILTFKISMVLTGIIVVFLIIFGLISNRLNLWFTVLIFIGLGLANYQFLRKTLLGNDDVGNSEIRNPWEKESDWWKK